MTLVVLAHPQMEASMFQIIRSSLAVVTAAVLLVLLSCTVAADAAGAATADTEQDPATRVLEDAAVAQGLLNEFWTQKLAPLYGLAFDTPDRLVAYRGSNNPLCGGVYWNKAENAYYCDSDNEEYVAFDLNLFTSLLERFPGDATTFSILAHEWGHAVQDTWTEQQPGVDKWSPDYNFELQADCLAGVFLMNALTRETLVAEKSDIEAIFIEKWESIPGPLHATSDHGTRQQRVEALYAGLTQDTHYCRVTYGDVSDV